MGMKHAGRIAETLIQGGRAPDAPCAVVAQATTPKQQVLETRLDRLADDIAKADMKPPAILCIGRSVLLRQVLDWQGMIAGQPPRNLDPLDRGRPAEEP
jgi:uroporphyrin-III C-methyltransferase